VAASATSAQPSRTASPAAATATRPRPTIPPPFTPTTGPAPTQVPVTPPSESTRPCGTVALGAMILSVAGVFRFRRRGKQT
jgi:hypothetical protein